MSQSLKQGVNVSEGRGSVPVGHTPHFQDSKRIMSQAGVTPFYSPRAGLNPPM